MPRKCKECKYKLNYESYCKDMEIKKEIEKCKKEVLSEISKYAINYADEPTAEVVTYNKVLKEKVEPQNNTYRILLMFLATVAIVLCMIVMIVVLLDMIGNKQFGFDSIITLVFFGLIFIAGVMVVCNAKKSNEQEAYNFLMAVISIVSLSIAIMCMND